MGWIFSRGGFDVCSTPGGPNAPCAVLFRVTYLVDRWALHHLSCGRFISMLPVSWLLQLSLQSGSDHGRRVGRTSFPFSRLPCLPALLRSTLFHRLTSPSADVTPCPMFQRRPRGYPRGGKRGCPCTARRHNWWSRGLPRVPALRGS